ELLAETHHTLNLLHRRLALAVCAPQVVLVADAYVLTEHKGHCRDGNQPSHAGPECIDRALRHAFEKMHQIKWIAAARPAAIRAERHVQRTHVDPRTDQPLDDLPLVNMSGNKVRLDAVLSKTFEVLDIERRR